MATDARRPAGRAARFLSVAETHAAARELARRYPGRYRLREIGRSRAGHPLLVLSVAGDGPAVLVVGGAHANEPVGWTSALSLARHLAEHPSPAGLSGLAWHFLFCVDPDGAVLAQGQSDGPYTMARHFDHFFRPPFHGQPEWLTARGDEGDLLPETLALTGLIDEVQPVLQCSLHGVDLGGALLELTRPVPGLPARFQESARLAGMPVDVGSYDAYGWASPSPGVYLVPAAEETVVYDVHPEDPDASTWTYAARYGGVTAVVEAPMWAADEVADGRWHPDPAAVLLDAAHDLDASREALEQLLTAAGPPVSGRPEPYRSAAVFHLQIAASLAAAWKDETRMTTAQATNIRIASERLPLRAAAMLLRAVGESPRVAHVRRRLEQEVAERRDRFARRFGARWIPVDDQVAHQVRTVLAAAHCVTATTEADPVPRTLAEDSAARG